MTCYVGVDIGKNQFDVHLHHQARGQSFSNSPEGFTAFLSILPATQTCHIAMEATGKYFFNLAQFLFNHQIKVSVVNPASIKYYAQSQLKRTKTDLQDAKLIAHYCQSQQPKLWQPPSQVIVELQEWQQFQALLIKQKTQLTNQMQTTECERLKQLQLEQIVQLEQEINEVSEQIKTLISQDEKLNEQTSLLTSIKGVGEKTAIQVLTLIKDIDGFDNAKQLASFAGVVPQIKQSGSSVNSSSLSKIGHSELRKCLYMPALAAIKFNPVIQTFAQNLQSRGITGKKKVVAVMRKLLHIMFAVLKHGKPFDPCYKIST